MVLFSKSYGKPNSQASSNGGKKRIPVFTSGNRGKYLNKITSCKITGYAGSGFGWWLFLCGYWGSDCAKQKVPKILR